MQAIVANLTTLNMEELISGMYLYEIRNTKGVGKKEKIIKLIVCLVMYNNL